MSNPPFTTVLTAALLALALVGCGGKKAAGAPAAGSAAMPPECAALQKRIAACKANVKNGKFEISFDDPQFLQSAEACREADKTVGDLAKMTGCES